MIMVMMMVVTGMSTCRDNRPSQNKECDGSKKQGTQLHD